MVISLDVTFPLIYHLHLVNVVFISLSEYCEISNVWIRLIHFDDSIEDGHTPSNENTEDKSKCKSLFHLPYLLNCVEFVPIKGAATLNEIGFDEFVETVSSNFSLDDIIINCICSGMICLDKLMQNLGIVIKCILNIAVAQAVKVVRSELLSLFSFLCLVLSLDLRTPGDSEVIEKVFFFCNKRHLFFLLVVKISHDHRMDMADCTVVAVKTHTLIATTIARVSESSLGLLLGYCRILVVHAYLFKFVHNVTSFL
nr:MAG TPA: hypothetical protein [Caudoviricetes sp.]